MIINNTEYFISALDVINLLREDLSMQGIKLLERSPRESGDNIQIQCPYHGNGQERKPSAGIRKSDGIFHCFACGETHSLPEVISFCFGHEDNGHYGKVWLDKNITDKRFIFSESAKQHAKQKTDNKVPYNKLGKLYDCNYVSEEELDEYRWTHPYWAKRGITEDWVIELFDLGYDREKQMITMPVRDELGRCEFVAKRSVKTKFFQYPPGVSKPLYGLYEINKKYPPFLTDVYGEKPRSHPTEIFVCESMIDCILLWQSNHIAVALNGLGNDRQFRQLRNLDVRRIILATDNDEAGKEAREKIKKNVQGKIFSEIIFPKDIKDIGECSREQIDNILQWEKYGLGRI